MIRGCAGIFEYRQTLVESDANELHEMPVCSETWGIHWSTWSRTGPFIRCLSGVFLGRILIAHAVLSLRTAFGQRGHEAWALLAKGRIFQTFFVISCRQNKETLKHESSIVMGRFHCPRVQRVWHGPGNIWISGTCSQILQSYTSWTRNTIFCHVAAAVVSAPARYPKMS